MTNAIMRYSECNECASVIHYLFEPYTKSYKCTCDILNTVNLFVQIIIQHT